MSKIVRALCVAATFCLLFLAVRALAILPMSKQALIEEKYDSWTGVLRLWTYEGWASGNGTLTGWLNACVERFEKAHPGVYVQAKAVDAEAIRALGESGINPPDLILFPPGLLNAPNHLCPLAIDAPLIRPLSASGRCDGTVYALPVAMGTYAWAYNSARLAAIPPTWASEDIALRTQDDTSVHSWSGAILALCSGLDSAQEASPALPGVDLGLPDIQAAPTAKASGLEDDGVPCSLPENFGFSNRAFEDFLSGGADVIPVTQRQLRRLELLSESGRAPDWTVAMPGAYALADQLALMAIVDWPRQDQQARQELCADFIAHLLTDESQARLRTARAFPVTEGIYAYEGGGAMASLEASLREKALLVPPAFGSAWHAELARLLEEFTAGRVSAREAIRRANRLFAENTNFSP